MIRQALFASVLATSLAMPTASYAGLFDILKSTNSNTTSTQTATNTALDTSTIVSGLREALKVGSQRAVEQVSQQGGYLNDSSIRIPLPSPLDKLESALRRVGMTDQVDQFETAINRAAEKAAPQAATILANTISNMSLTDARDIYSGGDHAATEYLRTHAGDQIVELFKPDIAKSLGETGATATYAKVAKKAQKLPIVGTQVNTDLTDYVANAALDGLFTKLGEQEALIRKDPAAQTSALLKKLWGNQ